MRSTIAKVAASVSLLALMAGPVSADETNTNSTAAGQGVHKTLNVACIQAAVGKRDDAVIIAFDAYHAAIRAALVTRRDTWKANWAITDKKQRQAAIATGWKAYRTAVSAARKALRTARAAAWKQYRADWRTCGASAGPEHNGEGTDALL